MGAPSSHVSVTPDSGCSQVYLTCPNVYLTCTSSHVSVTPDSGCSHVCVCLMCT